MFSLGCAGLLVWSHVLLTEDMLEHTFISIWFMYLWIAPHIKVKHDGL